MKLQSKQKLTRSYLRTVPIQNPFSKTVRSYYVGQDVFQRDQKYYEQEMGAWRSRSWSMRVRADGDGKEMGSGIGNDLKEERKEGREQFISNQHQNNQKDLNDSANLDKQRQALLQENRKLLEQLKQIIQPSAPPNQNSTQIPKKSHYTSSPLHKKIHDQQQKISELKQKSRKNSQKINKYCRGIEYMSQKLRRIKMIDSQIYGHIRGIEAKDRYLEERVKRDLRAVVRERFGVRVGDRVERNGDGSYQGERRVNGSEKLVESRNIYDSREH